MRLSLTPLINHWWNVPVYVTSRGLTTSPIPHGTRSFEVLFDIIRKYMIFDLASGRGGGIYLRKCVEDAQRWHDESFRQRVLSAFGSEPSYQYFDAPVIVDNVAHDVMIEAA